MKRFVFAGRLPDGLAAMSFFNGLVFFSPVSLLVRTTAGVSVSQFFLLQAVLSLAVLLGEVPSGRLTDRIGCRWALILCEGLFLGARVLLLAAFLTHSLPLFFLEAVVEGIAISFESGTQSAYLYGVLAPEDYLSGSALAGNWETAGYLASVLCYAGLYLAGGIPGLLGATAAASLIAFGASFALPAETRRPPQAERARTRLSSLLVTPRAMAVIGALAALSLAQIMVNFFYAQKLQDCGADAGWLTPIILAYSGLQMLAGPVLARLGTRQAVKALGVFCGAAGVGMAALGFAQGILPVVGLMLVLPLLLRLPGCVLGQIQNNLVDEAGQEERRAEVLSVFNMSGSVLEVIFLVGSSAVAAAGPVACFGVVGLLLAGAGWVSARRLAQTGSSARRLRDSV